MAAGLGFKTFTTGEVLTAADTNGYLMQGINVFASTAARDAAITSPAEGQFAFTKDTNGLWYYDGAAWVASGATGDIEGVTAGIGISGGGTSGTVTVTNSMATAIDAKGDLIAGTAADTFDRLAVGTNGQTLVADSTASTGLKWATPASGGGMTLISTTTFSSNSFTLSSIPADYINLMLIVKNVYGSADDAIYVRLNSDSGNNYSGFRYNTNNTTINANPYSAATVFYISDIYTSSTILNTVSGVLNLYRYTDTDDVNHYSYFRNKGANERSTTTTGVYDGTAAITSITIGSGASFSGGTVYLYGVK